MSDLLSWIADPINAEKVKQARQYLRCDEKWAVLLELNAQSRALLVELNERSGEYQEMTPDEVESYLEDDDDDEG